jgi:AraC family transcriptional regulator
MLEQWPPTPGAHSAMTHRRRLFESTIGLVERVECGATQRGTEEYSADFQIGFPYRGLFVWLVGGDAVMSDPNQVLFIKGGEPFRIREPHPDGFGEVIITPSLPVLSAISEDVGYDLDRHPLFRARSRRATPGLQQRCATFVHRISGDREADDFAAEEALLGLMREAVAMDAPCRASSRQTRRLIARTKEFLRAAYSRRLQLAEVADAVGASPAYLTHVFRRFEGISLQRYVTQLRLARALVELPHVADITTLALDLGFSSHSHFTLVFRRTFGCTPSDFRGLTRATARARIPDRISA